MTDSDESSSLLVAIIDTNPVWWGQRSLQNDGVSFKPSIIAHENKHSFKLSGVVGRLCSAGAEPGFGEEGTNSSGGATSRKSNVQKNGTFLRL